MNAKLLNALRSKFRKVRQAKAGDGHIEFRICCPFCASRGKRPDTKYKLYINGSNGLFHCWRCDYKGHVRSLIGDVTTAAAVQEAAQVKPVTNAETLDKIPPPYNFDGGLIPINRLDPDHPAILYLTKIRKRPFDPEELASLFGVCYCDKGRVFGRGRINYDTSNTLIFPLYYPHTKTGRPVVVGWQSRLLYDPDELTENDYIDYGYKRDEAGEWIVPPKYFTSPGMEKGRVLYNYLNARAYDYVVVTEGVFDAFSVGPCAVSLFGKSPTDAQIRTLMTYWERVIMLLDPGDADKETERAMRSLQRAVPVVAVKLAGTKDAGDLSRQEVWRQIAGKINNDAMKQRAVVNSYEQPSNN